MIGKDLSNPIPEWAENGADRKVVPYTVATDMDSPNPDSGEEFAFGRSGYRVPAVIISPWIAAGDVFNDEYRHTSLIATLREHWDLGDAFTARDATARTFSSVFTLDTLRDPKTWPTPTPRPVPAFHHDTTALGAALSTIGAALLEGIGGYAAQHDLEIEGLPDDPKTPIPADQVVGVLRAFVGSFFPLLTNTADTNDPSDT